MFFVLTSLSKNLNKNIINENLKVGQEVFFYPNPLKSHEFCVETNKNVLIGYFACYPEISRHFGLTSRNKAIISSVKNISKNNPQTIEIFINDLDKLFKFSQITEIKHKKGLILSPTKRGAFVSGVYSNIAYSSVLEVPEKYESFISSFFGSELCVSGIAASTFKNNSTFRTIVIKAPLILNNAFQNATKLQEIKVDQWLGFESFCDCRNLKKADLTATKYIGDNCFKNCTSLDEVLLGRIEYMGESAFEGCTSVSHLNLGNATIRTISNNAFMNCQGLKSIIFPKSLNSIGANAFLNCSNLETVVFEGEMFEVGVSAFENCSNLESVRFNDVIKTISKDAFKNCVKLKSVIFDKSIYKIDISAFENCESLEKFKINRIQKWLDRNLEYHGSVPFRTTPIEEILHLKKYQGLTSEKAKKMLIEDQEDFIDLLAEIYIATPNKR